MDVLERRPDGTMLCVLSASEAAGLNATGPTGDSLLARGIAALRGRAQRKWSVSGITALRGRPDAQHVFRYVVHAATREEAEREGAQMAIAERGRNGMLQKVNARDVTGKTRGIFGWH